MSQRIPPRAGAETPIERIFEKVMHRKMTAEERAALHLKGSGEHNLEKSGAATGLQFKTARN
jgi:hypothetical protein